jgi:hypothetical protein
MRYLRTLDTCGRGLHFLQLTTSEYHYKNIFVPLMLVTYILAYVRLFNASRAYPATAIRPLSCFCAAGFPCGAKSLSLLLGRGLSPAISAAALGAQGSRGRGGRANSLLRMFSVRRSSPNMSKRRYGSDLLPSLNNSYSTQYVTTVYFWFLSTTG